MFSEANEQKKAPAKRHTQRDTIQISNNKFIKLKEKKLIGTKPLKSFLLFKFSKPAFYNLLKNNSLTKGFVYFQYYYIIITKGH